METLPTGFTLDLCPGAFPLSTDSMVLSHFAKLPKNASVLDLGAGCGTLGLLLCSRDSGCRVTGIELDPAAHEAALEKGVKVTGATVHFVNEITDGGRIIAQKAVEVLEGDTPETLQRRVMEQAEWLLLPSALETVCKDLTE